MKTLSSTPITLAFNLGNYFAAAYASAIMFPPLKK